MDDFDHIYIRFFNITSMIRRRYINCLNRKKDTVVYAVVKERIFAKNNPTGYNLLIINEL